MHKKKILKLGFLVLSLFFVLNTHSQENTNFEITLFKGSVTDSITKMPLEAKIELYNAKTKELLGEYNSNSESGKFLITLHPGAKYRILVIAKKYQIHEEFIEIVAKKFKQISRDFLLVPFEQNNRFPIDNITFEAVSDSFKITDPGNLDILEKFILLNNKTSVEISAFNLQKDTSSSTKHGLEQKLNLVYNQILSKGIPTKRITKKSYQKDFPLAGYKPSEAIINNGIRFEFKILKK